jgi:adenylate cyclase
MKSLQVKFTGIGTVFMSDIINVSNLAKDLDPISLIDILKRHLNYITRIVEKHKGFVQQFEGDAVLAFWHPKHINPSHAQIAFDASCEIISNLPGLVSSHKNLTYDVDIVLGTGEMAGDLFGPGNVFQVIGMAMSIADRLSKQRNSRISCVRMSQYTLDLINPKDGIGQIGTIIRDNLDDLKVFMYCPANKALEAT